MGRTDVLTRTDLVVSHELKMLGDKKVRLELNMLNVFNQKTSRYVYNFLNRGGGVARASSAIDLSHTDLSQGYDYNALILASPDGRGAYDPRYGKDALFSEGASGFFTVKFLF